MGLIKPAGMPEGGSKVKVQLVDQSGMVIPPPSKTTLLVGGGIPLLR